MQPRAINPRPASLGQPGGTKKRMEVPPTAVIIVKASNFARSGMHFLFSQFEITGPKTRLASNQACILGEDLAKQAAATRTNGVVGNNGSATPTAPISRNKTPKIIQGFNVYHRNVQDAWQ
jgi:hypothetical protein